MKEIRERFEKEFGARFDYFNHRLGLFMEMEDWIGVAAIIAGDKRSYKDLLSEYKQTLKRKEPVIGTGIPEGGSDYPEIN